MLLSGIFLIIFLVFLKFRIMDFVPISSGIRKQYLIYYQVVSGVSEESVLTATLTSRLSSFSLTGPL